MNFHRRLHNRTHQDHRIRGLLVLIALAALVLSGITGCSWFFPDPLAVEGTWVLDSSYTYGGVTYTNVERWTITDETILYETSYDGTTYTTTYKADIADYSNGGLNAGDTALATGRAATANPGYAVICYTEVDGPGTGTVGKYNVFRWADNAIEAAKKDFIQGYKNVGADWPENENGVFDSAAEAAAGATNDAGYFIYSSNGAEAQTE